MPTPDIDTESRLRQWYTNKIIQQLEGKGEFWISRGSHGFGFSWMDAVVSPNVTKTYDFQNHAAILLATGAKHNNFKKAVPSLISNVRYQSKESYQNSFFPLRYRAIEALSAIKDPKAVDALIEVIHHSRNCLGANPNFFCSTKREYSENTQEEAIEALGEIGVSRPDIIELLMSGLKDQSSNIRYHSAIALAKMKAEQAIGPIINLFQNSKDYYNYASALGLFGARAQKAVPILVQKVTLSKEPESTIIEVLEQIDTPEAIKALREFAESHDSRRSNDAHYALRRFENRR